ncbi:MAG: MATE family efflux transporter [Planctomycetaceae bacterium]|nr:MATE family efflux transporter [Planctomycetaceae bacterium]
MTDARDDGGSDRSAQLGQEGVLRLLLRFSAPAIVGMMAQAMYNLIDRLFIGWALGGDGIAGIAVAFPLMLVMLSFGMLIGFGATSQISIRLGQRRKADAERILGNAATMLVVCSLAITALGLLFLDPMLNWVGASPTVLPLARDYLHVIVLGTVFQMVGFGLNAMIRGEGNPRVAMLSMLISVALNAILAPIFVFGFHGGMRGAAWATVASQAVSAVWVVAYFLRGKSVLRIRWRNLRPSWPVCAGICAIGAPPFAMQLTASLQQSLLNRQLEIYGGDSAVAAMGIIYALLMLVAMPIIGLNQGAQPIIGYNYGARRYDRVRKTLLNAILIATTLTVLGFSMAMLFPAPLIRLFAPHDGELVDVGARAIRIAACMFPIVGFQIVSSAYFQAVGKPKEALFLSLSRQLLVLVPALILLPRLFGLQGVWAAMPTADLASCVLTGLCLAPELRHLGQGPGA